MKLRIAALSILLCAAAGSACAADDAEKKLVTEAIHELVPNAKIDSIERSELDGFYTVVTGGQVVYVSADGQYLMQGSLFDLASRTDLTAKRMDGVRRAELADVPDAERIIFAPENPEYTVSVFTDIDCGYCRKLHSHVDEFNKLGIALEYLFFPRTGLGSPSYDKAVSVFCAEEQKQAFTLAKQGAQPEKAQCDNPVAAEFALGQKLGVTGTPTIIDSTGTIIGGYMTPEQMLAKLQAVENAGKTAAANESASANGKGG